MIVQAAEGSATRARTVILHEIRIDSRITISVLPITFKKETTGITERVGFNNQDTGKICRENIHAEISLERGYDADGKTDRDGDSQRFLSVDRCHARGWDWSFFVKDVDCLTITTVTKTVGLGLGIGRRDIISERFHGKCRPPLRQTSDVGRVSKHARQRRFGDHDHEVAS